MPCYLIDLGNSTAGCIGACARVNAATPEDAIAVLRDVLPECVEVAIDDERIESFTIYLSPEHSSVADISEGDVEDAGAAGSV